MTGPDPIAALAAQLEELRGQLAEFQRVFSQWNAKLETEGIGGTMTLLLDIKQLRDRLDEALAKHQLEPPLAPWWCVGAAEGRAMLAELSEWVRSSGDTIRVTRPASRAAGRATRRRCWSCPRSGPSGSGSTATRTTGTCRAPWRGMTGGFPVSWGAWPPRLSATSQAAGCPRRGPDEREGPACFPCAGAFCMP